MRANDYQTEMLRAAKFDLDFEQALALCGLGLTGEAGEVADMIKKILFHGYPLGEQERIKLLEEAGDVAWYLAYLCRILDSNFEEIFQLNIDKLKERYPNGFRRFFEKENSNQS